MSHFDIVEWVIIRTKQVVLGLLAISQSEKVRFSIETTIRDGLVALLPRRLLLDGGAGLLVVGIGQAYRVPLISRLVIRLSNEVSLVTRHCFVLGLRPTELISNIVVGPR